jgi:hypothetical protein
MQAKSAVQTIPLYGSLWYGKFYMYGTVWNGTIPYDTVES